MNAQRILAVIQKEWWEIVRDPLTLVMAFVVPMTLLLLVGFGMTFDVENIPLAIQDRDGSAMSRDYAYRFIGSRYFDFKGFLSGERDAIPLLADGKLRAVIIVPEQFERDLLAGRPASVQVLLDGAFPDRTRVTKGYISAITRAASLDSLADYLSRTQGVSLAQASQTLQPVSLEVRYLYNQSLKSDWSVPPKLLMFILFFTPAFMTSLRVVREKELGTILNIYTSPLTRMEFVVAKLAPYVGIAMVNLIAMWLVVMSVFGVPFKGSVPLFLGASLLYVIATTSIGMLVSVFVRTQIAAMLISLFITFVPALQYSGLEIPIASMGLDAQVIAHLMPAMYYTRIIDGSFLKGVGVSVLWPDIAMLAAYAAALAGACYLFFHKRVRM
jgi:ABC-2 type transport system permease protein/ribosome-dependent ATPase